MRPESGLMSPSASFRMRLLPDPATPNTAFVSPRGRWKETPRRTSLSSKAIATSSKIMAGAASSFVLATEKSSGKVGVDMGSAIGKRGHQEASDDQVHGEDKNGSRNHRLRSRAAHPLGSSARVHAIKAAYGGDDKAENNGLDQSHEHVLKH